MKKVHVIDDLRTGTMFKNQGWEVVDDLEKASLVVFTGGADVSPYLYGQPEHRYTNCTPWRDEHEAKLFDKAESLGIPMIGICRGGQFLNVMHGGSMWQHVNNHGGRYHQCRDLLTGEVIELNSYHHQQMIPFERGEIIAVADAAARSDWPVPVATIKEQMSKDGKILTRDSLPGYKDLDVEVVFYSSTHTLCFQPHPEYEDVGGTTHSYFFDLLTRFGYNG